LFRDIEAALGEDPAGEAAQALVNRWKAQLDEATQGDPEIKEAMLKGWSHRRNWPASMRWQVEALHLMSFDRFEKAADFLDQAAAIPANAAPAAEPARGATCQGCHDGCQAGVPEKKENPVSNLAVEMFLKEFDLEISSTRKLLDRLPADKFTWKPHEKSHTLGKLANHVAALPSAIPIIINGTPKLPTDAESKSALLEAFDQRVAKAREALATATDEHLAQTIHVTPTITKPRIEALRGFVMNHAIHHRGQLTVYLRILGVPVPGMYGPSADEKP
jgi:uncharacterized damage-inducible protein DinB